jgi:hypothetical protein
MVRVITGLTLVQRKPWLSLDIKENLVVFDVKDEFFSINKIVSSPSY